MFSSAQSYHLIRYICRLLKLLRGLLHLLYFSFYGFMLMVLCLCFKATRKCFNTWVGLCQCLLLFYTVSAIIV